MKINKVNYKSDFDLLATMKCYDTSGKEIEVGFADYDWELDLYTGCGNYAPKVYKVSYIGGKATNCFNDNGKVHIVCDNHKLPVGQLQMEFRSFLPNSNYPDGTQKVVATYDLDIELTTENTGITSAEVQIVLPFLYDSAYRQAVIAGYKGTQEEYFALASQLPNAVETATKVQASADSLADSAETIGGAIETLGATTDAIEQGANMIKDNADTLQASANKVSESATKVEQAVEPLVQASESLDATKQAFEMLSSEWVDGRQAIANALTNRKYPTEPSESFHVMADKITNMSYGLGIFEKIGYTESNNDIADKVNYSYELAKGWNNDNSTAQMFSGNKRLTYLPVIDTSNVTNMNSMFEGCSALITIPLLDTSKVTSLDSAFRICSALTTIPLLDTSKVTSLYSAFAFCSALITIPLLDMGKVTNMNASFISCSVLEFLKITNLGKSTLATYDFSGATIWGVGSEENRQSLIDSLITYSYDRASNGMATATIKLSANTKALLTEEEIAQITNKGFTIS